MSTTLIRLDAENDTIGGFQITFPSQCTKRVHWCTEAPIVPALDAAKQYAAKTIETLISEGKQDDVDRTNWTSVVAAIQRIILDFNDALRASIHKAAGH